MPIDDKLLRELVNLSNNGKHDAIYELFIKKLNAREVTAQDIFDFAKDKRSTNKPDKPYVINAATINSLGVFLARSEDRNLKESHAQFCKLAADRGSSWGCHNYAQYILNNDKKEALTYIRKAVALAKNNPNEEHEHDFMFVQLLAHNNEHKEANRVLVTYLEFLVEKTSSIKKPEAKIKEKLEEALNVCETRIDDYMCYVKDKNMDELTGEECQSLLEVIEPFLNCKCLSDFNDKSKMILQKAYYVKAKCHEKLRECSEAMHAYCSITDKNFPQYSEVITARVRLLKAQVAKDFNLNSTAPADIPIEEEKESLLLPSGMPLLAKFSKSWSQDTSWFHSADEKEIKNEFDKRLEQLQQLISAKKIEIALIDELPEESKGEATYTEKKENIQNEVEKLQEIKKKLEKKYKDHLPDERQVFRRHAAESHFFNPKRSKKREDLLNLTYAIIDQRFQTINSNSALTPINLTGKSSRQVISAERIFQNAVIALASKERSPNLGIPKVKANERSWENERFEYRQSGVINYGPIECYKVGETKMQSIHRTSPKRNRLGDSYLPQLGAYDRIYFFLNKLANGVVENEKQLAAFMIRYGKSHQPVSLEELQAIYSKANTEDIDYFNQMCFLIMEKEQSQWHSAVDKKFQLGMSVSQARCLIMIKAGFISFEEAFKNNALFGIYSQTRIINDPTGISESCKRIDKLYLSYLQNKYPKEHFSFLKNHINNNQPPTCVLTREQAHQDMKEVYGGSSDTESEDGYNTDLSM